MHGCRTTGTNACALVGDIRLIICLVPGIERGLVDPSDLENVHALPTDYAKKSRLVWQYLSTRGPALERYRYADLSSHLRHEMERPDKKDSHPSDEGVQRQVEDPHDVVEVCSYKENLEAIRNRVKSALSTFLCGQGEKLELISVVSVNSDDVDNEEQYPGGPY